MIYIPRQHDILRRAGQEIQRSAEEKTAEIMENPTPLDAKLPITDERGPSVEDVTVYLNECEENEEPIDFAALANHIANRRQLLIDQRGVIYDPIDDANAIPDRRHLVRYIDEAHKQKYAAEILEATGVDVNEAPRRRFGSGILSAISYRLHKR